MSTQKKTMYEILEVPQTASIDEIKAAHKRQSLKIMSASSGLSREECEFQLSVLDVALQTLSTPYSRDAYDASLFAAAMPMIVDESVAVMPSSGGAAALRVAGAMGESYKSAAHLIDLHQPEIQAATAVASTTVKSLKTIMRGIIGLVVLAVILKTGSVAMSSRHSGRPSAEVIRAEEKLVIQEYYHKYGVRPASADEARLLERERLLAEKEQKAAEFEKKRKEEEYQQFVAESEREGERVAADLEREQRRAEYEEMRQEQEQAAEERQREWAAEEAERRYIANERRKLGLY